MNILYVIRYNKQIDSAFIQIQTGTMNYNKYDNRLWM